MDLHGFERLAALQDLSRRFTRLGGFWAVLDIYRREIAPDLGLAVNTDRAGLNRAFFDWMEAVDRDARFYAIDRQDFLVFSAGLLLRELLRHDPCVVEREGGEPVQASPNEILAFWPSGYFYTGFCLTSLAAMSRRHGGRALLPGARADDLRSWWSFRENVRRDCAAAIGFLDLFLDREPNWAAPDRAEARAAIRHRGAAAMRHGQPLSDFR